MDSFWTPFLALLITAPEPARERFDSDPRQERREAAYALDVISEQPLTDLVRGLSSANYRTREASEEQILKRGLNAVPALLEESTGRSEVAIRAATLVDTIRREHLRRLCSASIDGRVDAAIQLPMWDRFRLDELSDTDRAIALGKILSAVPNLRLSDQLAFPLGSQELQQQRSVYTELYRRLATLDLPYSVTTDRRNAARAALLVGGHPATILTKSDAVTLGPLLSRGEIGRMMASPDEQPVAEWLILNYIQNLPDDGKVHAFPIVLRFRVRDVSDMARVVLQHGLSPRPLAQAAAALSGSGTAADVALLKPLLDRPDFFGGGQSPVQLNDVALYAAILLTEQDPRDYGFRAVARQTPGGFDIYSLRYVRNSLRRRREAFEKWARWEQTQFRAPAAPPKDAIHGERL